MSKMKPRTATVRTGVRQRRPVAVRLVPQNKVRARAELIRQVITSSTTDLLRVLDPERSIPKVLKTIGAASGVSRI